MAFGMFGLEEYYNDLLNEAKSPEEIKRILHYQFVEGKGVPEEVFENILNADPTKKKSYTKWALIHWDSESKLIVKLVKEDKFREIFEYFQSRQNSGLNLSSVGSIEEAVRMLPTNDPVLTKVGNGGPEDNYEIVYDTPDWKIAVPHSYQASVKLGQGCKWCTAGAFGDGPGYYRRYTEYGPLWINFDMRRGEICPVDKKEYPYKRYQFLFEYRNFYGELMDSRDNRVEFENIHMPQEVIDFYGEQDERYAQVINGEYEGEREYTEDDWNDYYETRRENGYTLKASEDSYHDLLLLVKSNDEVPVYSPDGEWFVYDGDDESDPICLKPVPNNPEECVVEPFYNEYYGEDAYPCIILRTTTNEHFACYKENNGSRSSSYWTASPLKNEQSYGTGSLAWFITDRNTLFVCDEKSECDYMIPVGDLNTMSEYDVIVNPEFLYSEISKGDGYLDFYSDGSFIQVNYSNGYSALFYVEKDDFETVISKDVPLYDEGYKIEYDEKNDMCYIRGRFGVHYLSANHWGTPVNYSYDLEEELQDNAYIVRYRHSGDGKYYNIYLKDKNEFLYDSSDIEKLPSKIRPSKNAYSALVYFREGFVDFLNIKTLRKERFEKIDFVNGTDFYVGYNMMLNNGDLQKGVSIFLENGKIIGSFANIQKALYNGRFVVKINEQEPYLGLFDANDAKLYASEYNFERYGVIGDYGEYIVFWNEELQMCIYDSKYQKITMTGIKTMNCCNIISDGYAYKIYKDGKVNVFYKGALLIPENATKIIAELPDHSFAFTTSDNKVMFFNTRLFLNGSKIIIFPSTNGINNEYIKDVHAGAGIMLVTMNLQDDETGNDIECRFYADKNRLIAMTTPAAPNTKENQQKVDAIVNSQITQMAENFNKIYNKISKTKF